MSVTNPTRTAGHEPSPEVGAESLLARVKSLEVSIMGMSAEEGCFYSDREVLDGLVDSWSEGLWRAGHDSPLCRFHAEQHLRQVVADAEAEHATPAITDDPTWLSYALLGRQCRSCKGA